MVSGAGARNKGLNMERFIARAMSHIFPKAKRHLESQACEAKGYDLDHTGEFKIQIKRNKKYCSISKIKEIQVEGKHVLITKGDRERAICCMYFEDWIELVEAYEERRSNKTS